MCKTGISGLYSTAYLPPISYISACLHAEQVLIEQFETYPRQTIRNRCKIYGPNGMQVLSIPVIKSNGNHTMTRDIRVASTSWQRHHWRSVETAYNNSPFFLYYKDDFERVFNEKFDFLLDVNTRLLEIIFRILGMEKKIIFTEHFMDFREGKKNPEKSFPNHEKKTVPVFPPYTQVFSPKHGFIADLSIIDLIFNLGPDSFEYLV